MISHHLTVSTLARSLAGLTPAEVAVTQLQGRCTARVCYAQKTTSTGERAYGHFSMDSAVLAEAVAQNLSPHAFDVESEPSADLTLHRWLNDHESAEAETDESASALPPAWPGLEHLVEELMGESQTRVFCTCCNRNIAHRDLRLERSSRHSEGVRFRYLCAEGHVLLGLRAGHVISVAEQHAA